MLKLRGGKVLQKLKDMVNAETTETVNATEKNQSILDMLEAAEQENTDISAVLENTDNSEDIGSIENMESAVKVNTSADTAVQQPVYIEPVKIADLARNLILLSGHKPEEDIQILYTGLRPGEKLYEEMLMDEEGLQETDNKLIHIGKPIEFDESAFYVQLNNLKKAVENECEDVRSLIQEIVPTYIPKAEPEEYGEERED